MYHYLNRLGFQHVDDNRTRTFPPTLLSDPFGFLFVVDIKDIQGDLHLYEPARNDVTAHDAEGTHLVPSVIPDDYALLLQDRPISKVATD